MDCVFDVVGQMLTHSPSSLQFLREAFRRHTIPQCSAGSKAVRAAFNNSCLFSWLKKKLEPSHTLRMPAKTKYIQIKEHAM